MQWKTSHQDYRLRKEYKLIEEDIPRENIITWSGSCIALTYWPPGETSATEFNKFSLGILTLSNLDIHVQKHSLNKIFMYWTDSDNKKWKGIFLPYTTIINSIQTNFMTTISYSDVGTYVSICIPDLGNKRMDSLIFSINDELGKDYCVRCMLNRNNITNFNTGTVLWHRFLK